MDDPNEENNFNKTVKSGKLPSFVLLIMIQTIINFTVDIINLIWRRKMITIFSPTLINKKKNEKII